MEIQYFGGNCVRISTKKAAIVIDDNLADMGAKSVTKPGDVALFTGIHGSPRADVKIAIDQPGEYEASGVSIRGIQARAHIDEEKQRSATMYRLVADDIRVAVLGHVYPELSNDQLEQLGTVDVLVIPTGGNGYTLDPIGALKLIKEIEPKLVIPTHYDDKALTYTVPQQPLDDVLKGLGMEAGEPITKLKIREGELGDVTQLAVLERQ